MVSNSHLLYKLWEIIHDLESSFWDAFEDTLIEETARDELSRLNDPAFEDSMPGTPDEITY